MPNPALNRGAGLDTWEAAGTWIGSPPDSVLIQAFEYLWYNCKQLEPKARKGESLEINSFAIVRVAVIRAVKHVVRTFEKGALPDDGDVLHAEIDGVLEDFGLNGSNSVSDEDPTEWIPGDSDPVPDPLADLGRWWR